MAQRRIKLAAFDMEGCLTDDPTVWEIMHRKLGTWESHGQPYWDRYRAGEFEYDTFARMDVAVWRGAPADLLRAAAHEIPLMPGCAELMNALSEAGVDVAVISNGLHCVAGRFRDEFGVEHIHANRVETRDGRLTGEIDIRVPYEHKGRVLRELAGRLGVSRDEIAAVGDSASDIEMFRQAVVSIAFRPSHPSVSAAATHTVDDKDLGSIIDVLIPA
ncbi:MAG: HAD family phosphatase [Planctomycetota bacterium]